MNITNAPDLLCENPAQSFRGWGRWHGFGSPLQSSSSLLLVQLSAISLVSQLIDVCLKPLGQSSIVSQILGGIVFGPSLLGRREEFGGQLFPPRGTVVLKTFATFGLMFFLFAIGVQMDPLTMIRPGRAATGIALSVTFFTSSLPLLLAIILRQSISMDASLFNSLIRMTISQSLTGFPVIACLLTELKILNTDVGRLALSTSMVCDLIGIFLTAIALSVGGGGTIWTSIFAISSSFGLVAFMIYVIRPAVIWMRKKTHEGKSIDEFHIFAIFIFVLLTGYLSEVIGQHYVFGPLILGLVVPEGPPLGAAIVEKLETLASLLFYPTYLAVSGLQTNVFKIQLQTSWVMAVIVFFSFFVKIAAVMVPAKFTHLSRRDAFVLGLVLNAKGIIELMVFNIWKDSQLLSDQEFAVCVMSVLVITAIVTPLIKFLYDPSKQYYSIIRSSMQHSKRESEFRVVVGIHSQDDVPTILNLLEVSFASEQCHVIAIALILVELIGRTVPVLISHQNNQRTTAVSKQILNALKKYEEENEGYANLYAFTSVSRYEIMHNDIIRVAIENRVNMLVLPFHKQWAIDGSVGSVNRAIQNLNITVLEMAPCSVAILVDRGALGRQISLVTTKSSYKVGILFIGGSDDAESLAYGSRMANHTCVQLTVVRFLLFGAENTKDRKVDSDLIHEYRQANMGNDRFVVMDEMVKDGEGLSSAIKRMTDCFDLILVGRHHPPSQVLAGLDQWSECPELGVVGDMLASPDFGTTASVLVVQQQRAGRPGGLKIAWEGNDKVKDREREEVQPKGSWAISMDG